MYKLQSRLSELLLALMLGRIISLSLLLVSLIVLHHLDELGEVGDR